MKNRSLFILLSACLLASCEKEVVEIKPIALPKEAAELVTVDEKTKISYVEFGSYQQERVNVEATVIELNKLTPDEDGYYNYDGKKYVVNKGKYFNTKSRYEKENVFVDDSVSSEAKNPNIKNMPSNFLNANGETYFEVQPIKWQVVEYDNGIFTLMADRALYTGRFNNADGDNPNDYNTSEAFTWLNDTFKNIAFSANEVTKLVGNINLPTSEQLNLEFVSKSAKASDYAISFKNYAISDSNNKNFMYCHYWTMSKSTITNKNVNIVVPQGYIFEYVVTVSTFGYRPVIKVEL